MTQGARLAGRGTGRLVAVTEFVLFELAWFVCVSQAAHGRPAWGVAAVAVVVGLQLLRSAQRGVDARLVALALAVGVAWDTGLLQAGIVRYAAPGPVAGMAPAWILALWALFAVLLRVSLRWLYGRWRLAALFGAIGGPVSYAAAERLGACLLPNRTLAFAVLGIGWGLITPVLVEAARRLEGHRGAAGVPA